MVDTTLLTDPLPVDPDKEIAQTYPVPEDKHIGVDTNMSTPPEVMDQSDEEETREQSGIPN